MTGFQDHFSTRAEQYARYRPHYPAELFDWIAAAAPGRAVAVDCATGNGQAAVALARRFGRVIATDASAAQLRHAARAPNVFYRRAFAEATALPGRSVEAVTVAQALHWLDRPGFYAEARRVLAPRGIVVVWSYALMHIAPAIDRIVNRFYRDKVGPYWPTERRLTEDGYRSVEFPFAELPVPAFRMRMDMTLDSVAGYIATWSATKGYRERTGEDPVAPLVDELRPVWGDPATLRTVEWPLSVRAGVV